MLRRQAERHARWLVAILVLAMAATASTAYVLSRQQVTTPLADRYTVRIELSSASGLEPGFGQPVNVAGVRVGGVDDVELREGRALVTVRIDPDRLPRVYENATATLVPNSPLQDLQIELAPGGRPARALRDGGTVPVGRTAPPGALHELTSTLDRDTRDFFVALVAGADEGMRGRGAEARRALKALAPTAAQLRAIGSELVARRRELRRAVRNLSLLTRAGAAKDRELAQVVGGASATVEALASREGDLRASVARLPRVLRAARDVVRRREFTRELPSTLDALLPAARKLPRALRSARPLAAETGPLLRRQLRPLVHDAQPLAARLAPAARDLRAVTPRLTRSFDVLRYLANELGHEPAGPADGYLFWLAWLSHNLNSALSTADAHGAVFRGFDVVSCDLLTQQPPLVELLTQLSAPIPAC